MSDLLYRLLTNESSISMSICDEGMILLCHNENTDDSIITNDSHILYEGDQLWNNLMDHHTQEAANPTEQGLNEEEEEKEEDSDSDSQSVEGCKFVVHNVNINMTS